MAYTERISVGDKGLVLSQNEDRLRLGKTN